MKTGPLLPSVSTSVDNVIITLSAALLSHNDNQRFDQVGEKTTTAVEVKVDKKNVST